MTCWDCHNGCTKQHCVNAVKHSTHSMREPDHIILIVQPVSQTKEDTMKQGHLMAVWCITGVDQYYRIQNNVEQYSIRSALHFILYICWTEIAYQTQTYSTQFFLLLLYFYHIWLMICALSSGLKSCVFITWSPNFSHANATVSRKCIALSIIHNIAMEIKEKWQTFFAVSLCV